MGVAQASDYLENKIVDHLFRGVQWVAPTTLYLGLMNAAPTDAGASAEVVGGGYTRLAVPCTLTNWRATQGGNGASTGDTGTTANLITLVFPAPTGGWGNITHFGIFDALTGGNLLLWDAVASPQTVNAGDPAPAFPIDALAVTVS